MFEFTIEQLKNREVVLSFINDLDHDNTTLRVIGENEEIITDINSIAEFREFAADNFIPLL